MAHRPSNLILIGLSMMLIVAALSVTPVAASVPSFETLLIFKGASNGGQPWSPPILDESGNLYGTTSEGGNGACYNDNWLVGCGTVYEFSPPASPGDSWTETLLYQFQGDADGVFPVGGLVFDKAGNLYGTTEMGGTPNGGTVFELTPPASGSGPWIKTILHNFSGGVAQGSSPEAGLTFDKRGNLYGTTTYGGDCDIPTVFCGGVVFELTPPAAGGTGWTYTVLYTFQGMPDGAVPQGTLIFDGSGRLYGTTEYGGSSNEPETGGGTVFQLTPPSSSGGAWTESVLYAFLSQPGDGYAPRSGVVFGKSGALYGDTVLGFTGSGTVFQLAPPASPGDSWTESVLYAFSGSDGNGPFGRVTLSRDGSIYGTTFYGGSLEMGNVFQLTPPSAPGNPWVETSLDNFNNSAYPIAGLTFGKNGWLYGATLGGINPEHCGTNSAGERRGCGELFRIRP
jgi:uncharacterized repeat protein (TIGR03803 family)